MLEYPPSRFCHYHFTVLKKMTYLSTLFLMYFKETADTSTLLSKYSSMQFFIQTLIFVQFFLNVKFRSIETQILSVHLLSFDTCIYLRNPNYQDIMQQFQLLADVLLFREMQSTGHCLEDAAPFPQYNREGRSPQAQRMQCPALSKATPQVSPSTHYTVTVTSSQVTM